jgi:hypothetical protein
MMLSLAISLSLVGTARANGVRRVGRAVPLRTRTLLSSHFAPSPVKRFSTIYLSLLLFLLSLTLFSLCLSLFLSICSICSFFPLSFTINRHCIYALFLLDDSSSITHRVPLYITKQWILGKPGHACEYVCHAQSCQPQPPKAINTKAQMEYALAVALDRTDPFDCGSSSDGNPGDNNKKINSPYLSGNDTCVWTPDQNGGSCADFDPNFQRLCCCGTKQAMCPSPCTTDAECNGLTNPPSAYSLSLLCCIATTRTMTTLIFSHRPTLPTALALLPSHTLSLPLYCRMQQTHGILRHGRRRIDR